MMDNRLSRRRFIAGSATAGFFLMLPAGVFAAGKESAGAKNYGFPEDGCPWLKTRDDGSLKILVITDLHLTGQKNFVDPETFRVVTNLVNLHSPDFIVVTGDMWNNNPDGKGFEFCKYACKELMKYKTPWAFTWGNHDMMDDYDRGHKLLESAPYSLYKGAASDGNYRIEVRTDAASEPVWNFIMLNDAHVMRKPQQDWFEAEAANIQKQTPEPPPAFLFFHIPLLQYVDLAESGKAKGVKLENVCYDGEDGSSLKVFSKYKWVKAMFCGHDHVNDYYGEMEGIHLEYIRATGFGSYGNDKVRKGGTLITIDTKAGTFDSISVLPDGTTWSTDKFITKVGKTPY